MNWTRVTRVSGTFAFFLFTCSIFYPFIHVQLFGIKTFTGSPGPEIYWSFKATSIYFRTPDNPGPPIIREYWFVDYWTKYSNYKTIELGLAMSTVLVFLFAAQVFTALLGALTVFKVRAYLSLSAGILNVFTTVCIWLISRAFVYPYFRCAFQAGFWLTFASATLFFSASVLNWKGLRK